MNGLTTGETRALLDARLAQMLSLPVGPNEGANARMWLAANGIDLDVLPPRLHGLALYLMGVIVSTVVPEARVYAATLALFIIYAVAQEYEETQR